MAELKGLAFVILCRMLLEMTGYTRYCSMEVGSPALGYAHVNRSSTIIFRFILRGNRTPIRTLKTYLGESVPTNPGSHATRITSCRVRHQIHNCTTVRTIRAPMVFQVSWEVPNYFT